MTLRYTPAAALDLEEIFDYIADELYNPDAARGIIASITKSCSRLKDNPYMGISLSKKTGRNVEGRCLISGHYLIVYDVDQAVSILRVLDTRTDYLKILSEFEH